MASTALSIPNLTVPAVVQEPLNLKNAFIRLSDEVKISDGMLQQNTVEAQLEVVSESPEIRAEAVLLQSQNIPSTSTTSHEAGAQTSEDTISQKLVKPAKITERRRSSRTAAATASTKIKESSKKKTNKGG